MRLEFPLVVVFLTNMCLAAPIPITWSNDIAKICYERCASCHRPGQPVPFPLLRYDDVKKRATLIRSVIDTHYMPPWKPVSGFGTFAGANRLTPQQISLVDSWVGQGAPQGDPHLAPPVPTFPSEWQLGEPDDIVSLPHPYSVPADGPDQYRCFVIPTAMNRERYVRAFQFDPSGSAAIHHALVFVDARRQPPSLDPYDCFGTPGFLPSGALGGWSPGSAALSMPPRTATHLPRGSRFVVQLHFHPTGKAEMVTPRIALYFSEQPPTRVIMDVGLGSNRIDIPAGDAHYIVRDHFELPVPVQVTGVIPHAHYLCRDMKAWAVLPGGRKRWLLWIQDWDFNWQEQYRYAEPFTLPAGTKIEMEFTYNNSDGNVHNPNHPPQRVTWGAGSTDEMAGLHLQVIPANDDDMHELGMAMWGKVMRGVGGSFYHPERPEPAEPPQ